jgi:hypothetical protein
MDYTEAQECLINTLGKYRNKYILRQPIAIRVGWHSDVWGYMAYSLELNLSSTGKDRQSAISKFKSMLMKVYFASLKNPANAGTLSRERERLMQWLVQGKETTNGE